MATKTKTRRRSADHLEIVVRPERSLPLRVLFCLWRWRWELFISLLFLGIYGKLLEHNLTEPQALAVMAAPIVIVVAIPWSRSFLVARLWCILTRHRVRNCLVQMRVLNWDARLPLILLVRPTNVGECVWLWMRPGLSLVELDNRTEHIAAACYAREARLQRSRRWATLIRLDVVRRDPLTTPKPIDSPLLGATARVPSQLRRTDPDGSTAAALPEGTPATDTPQPDTIAAEANGLTVEHIGRGRVRVRDPRFDQLANGRRSLSTPAPTPEPTTERTWRPGPVSVNGEDVSDYV